MWCDNKKPARQEAKNAEGQQLTHIQASPAPTKTAQHTQASTTLTAWHALVRRQRFTFQGLAHEEGQEAELQLAQQVTRLIAKVLLQDVAEQACLVQVEGSKLLGIHARHLHTIDKTQSQEENKAYALQQPYGEPPDAAAWRYSN